MCLKRGVDKKGIALTVIFIHACFIRAYIVRFVAMILGLFCSCMRILVSSFVIFGWSHSFSSLVFTFIFFISSSLMTRMPRDTYSSWSRVIYVSACARGIIGVCTFLYMIRR